MSFFHESTELIEGLFGFGNKKKADDAARHAAEREAEQEEKKRVAARAAKALRLRAPTDEHGVFKVPQEVDGKWFIRANDPYPSPDKAHALKKMSLYKKDMSSEWKKAQSRAARNPRFLSAIESSFSSGNLVEKESPHRARVVAAFKKVVPSLTVVKAEVTGGDFNDLTVHTNAKDDVGNTDSVGKAIAKALGDFQYMDVNTKRSLAGTHLEWYFRNTTTKEGTEGGDALNEGGAIGAPKFSQSGEVTPPQKAMLASLAKGDSDPTAAVKKQFSFSDRETQTVYGKLKSTGYIGSDDKITPKGMRAIKEAITEMTIDGKVTIEVWMTILAGHLTREAQKASNSLALGHYLEALNDVKKAMSSKMSSSDPKDVQKLISELKKAFIFEGGRFGLRQLNRAVKKMEDYIRSGKEPKYESWEDKTLAMITEDGLSKGEYKAAESWETEVQNMITEAMDPPVMKELRNIAGSKRPGKVNGKNVDGYTARSIVDAFDKMRPPDRSKFIELPIMKMADVAFRTLKRGR